MRRKINRNTMHRKIWGVDIEPETYNYLLIGPSLTAAEIATIDNYIKLIKYSTGVTLASVTCNLSTVIGAEFITNPSVDLRWIAPGWKVSAYDGTKTAYATKLGNGTGETLSSDLLAGWNLTSGWSPVSSTITNATTFTATATNAYVYKSILTDGTLYKGSFSATPAQGTVSIYDTNSAKTQLANGASSAYFTVQTGNGGRYRVYNSGTANGLTCIVNSQSLYTVLTPSATGITLNTWTIEAGFNPNAAAQALTITLT